jgi:hypothetical protein
LYNLISVGGGFAVEYRFRSTRKRREEERCIDVKKNKDKT